jgi:hypothetical protein
MPGPHKSGIVIGRTMQRLGGHLLDKSETQMTVIATSAAGLFRDVSHCQARHDIPAESKQ